MTTELHECRVIGKKEQTETMKAKWEESGLKITQFKLEFFKPSKAFSPFPVKFYVLSFSSSSFPFFALT